jgi:hypothetical protein
MGKIQSKLAKEELQVAEQPGGVCFLDPSRNDTQDPVIPQDSQAAGMSTSVHCQKEHGPALYRNFFAKGHCRAQSDPDLIA